MLNMSIVMIDVDTSVHNGTARVHVSRYLGHSAQEHVDKLVRSNKDIAAATLISESQTIVIEAQRRTTTAEELENIVRGFCSAFKQWYSELDELEVEMFSYHPNPRRDAFEAYSASSTFHGADRSD